MNQFLLLETDPCTETRLGVTTVEGLQPNLYYIVGVTPSRLFVNYILK